MPRKPPSICSRGKLVQPGERCPCKRTQEREYDKRRGSAKDRGYGAQWRVLRADFLSKNPTCRMCKKPATVADHIRPHRGNQTLFWDINNIQPLCKRCHDSIKQSIERQSEYRP